MDFCLSEALLWDFSLNLAQQTSKSLNNPFCLSQCELVSFIDSLSGKPEKVAV